MATTPVCCWFGKNRRQWRRSYFLYHLTPVRRSDKNKSKMVDAIRILWGTWIIGNNIITFPLIRSEWASFTETDMELVSYPLNRGDKGISEGPVIMLSKRKGLRAWRSQHFICKLLNELVYDFSFKNGKLQQHNGIVCISEKELRKKLVVIVNWPLDTIVSNSIMENLWGKTNLEHWWRTMNLNYCTDNGRACPILISQVWTLEILLRHFDVHDAYLWLIEE